MAGNTSSDTWIGVAGIGSAIAGVISVTTAPGPVKWHLFLPIIAGLVLFIGALVVFDRTVVRTGRISESTAIIVFLTAILVPIAVLLVIAPD